MTEHDRPYEPEYPDDLREIRPPANERYLGRGCFGVVWSVNDYLFDRVALKYIPFDGKATPIDKDRLEENFLKEVRASRDLSRKHKVQHVVPVHHGGRVRSGLWYTMDLIERTDSVGADVSLQTIVKDSSDWREIDPVLCLRIASQVADVLDKAHPLIIHRDVKPDNILVERLGDEPHVYLADFGIARIMEASPKTVTASGEQLGSEEYRSPEQKHHSSDKLTGFSDVYSLGRVLYFMLTRETPPRLGEIDLGLVECGPATKDLRSLIGRTQEADIVDDRETAAQFRDDCKRLIREQEALRLENSAQSRIRGRASSRPPSVERPAGKAGPGEPTKPRANESSEPPGNEGEDRKKFSVGILLASSFVVLGVALGAYLIGQKPKAAPKTVQSIGSSMRIPYSSPWVPAGSQVTPMAGLNLRNPSTIEFVAGSGNFLSAGRLVDAQPGSNPLSKATESALRSSPAPSQVGKVKGLLGQGPNSSLLLIPTTKGWFSVACTSSRKLTKAFRDACQQAISKITFHRVKKESLTPLPATAAAVEQALDKTNKSQRDVKKELNSDSLSTRADAAEQAAEGIAAAAESLKELEPRIQDRKAISKLESGIRSTANGFSALASTARKKNESGYNEAKGKVQASRDEINRGVDLLRGGGYRIKWTDKSNQAVHGGS